MRIHTVRQAKYTYSYLFFHVFRICYISCFIYISNAHSKYLPLLDSTSYCIISFIWAFFIWELNRSSVHNAEKPRLANIYWDGMLNHVWLFYLPILFDYTKHQLCFVFTKYVEQYQLQCTVKIRIIFLMCNFASYCGLYFNETAFWRTSHESLLYFSTLAIFSWRLFQHDYIIVS